MTPKPVTIDFETFAIEGRPDYPPKPVGVAIKIHGKAAKYYAWGHPTGNNCTLEQAKSELAKVWDHKDGMLFQNAKFDLDVANVHMGLALPSWDRVHDTMFLLFLDDPHQRELSLKPSAERLLGMPPEEQDAVADWLEKNYTDVKVTRAKGGNNFFGKFISQAPGDLVGKYGIGDVVRTEKLFDLLYPRTVKRGMLTAYDRERKLLPVLLEMERQGLPVDLKRLRSDVDRYKGWFDRVNLWLIKKLKADSDINLESPQQLMAALIRAGLVDSTKLRQTATGKVAADKAARIEAIKDPAIVAVLSYWSHLKKCLNTYMEPWLRVAEKSDGLIYTNWNQVKSPRGDDSIGTSTGRLSSTPNFQNLPKEFTPTFRHEGPAGNKLPKCPIEGLPSLPEIRAYVTPFRGEVLIDRDYSQQEPRILAHFAGGDLLDAYVADPWIDFHDYARQELAKKGYYYERKPVKIVNLGLMYGMGVGKLAEQIGATVEVATELKRAVLSLYPGLKDMYAEMKARARANQPIRTWGGREYYCEPPQLINGRIVSFDYKMVNLLIQGSAADCTKEALIRFNVVRDPAWRILLNVHDQITVSVPRRDVKRAMEVLRSTMESVEFDVKILSEGSTSSTNWAELKDYDKKGVVLRGVRKTG